MSKDQIGETVADTVRVLMASRADELDRVYARLEAAEACLHSAGSIKQSSPECYATEVAVSRNLYDEWATLEDEQEAGE